jgi:hypothetical protein
MSLVLTIAGGVAAVVTILLAFAAYLVTRELVKSAPKVRARTPSELFLPQRGVPRTARIIRIIRSSANAKSAADPAMRGLRLVRFIATLQAPITLKIP